jgi:hypothetical protein
MIPLHNVLFSLLEATVATEPFIERVRVPAFLAVKRGVAIQTKADMADHPAIFIEDLVNFERDAGWNG